MGVQPVPKTVYSSSHHDRHNRLQCDSNLGPLTPQSDALTTWPLRPAVVSERRFGRKYRTVFGPDCLGPEVSIVVACYTN